MTVYSQNAQFRCVQKEDLSEYEPKGEQLASLLRSAIAVASWKTDPVENWRDIGWHFMCYRNDASVEFMLVGEEQDQWMVQIAPSEFPKRSIFNWLSGKPKIPPSATQNDCFDVSVIVHKALQENGCDKVRWKWSGPATGADTTEAPIPADI